MIRKFFGSIFNALWSLFINGLLTILPIAITFTFFSFIFRLLKTWLAPLQKFQDAVPYLNNIPHAEILLGFAVIFLAGLFLKSFVIRSIIQILESIVELVPLVRPIYTGVKQLVSAFSPQDTYTFKKVVLVEFPRSGVYSIGFQTTQLAPEVSPDPNETFYNIFVPTTPNPTTGYFIIVKQQDFKPVDLTTQEAMALIISGGIVQPQRMAK